MNRPLTPRATPSSGPFILDSLRSCYLLNSMVDPDLREVPVIMLSARAGEEARIEGVQSGADDYLVKPFSARELIALVATHIGIARVRRNAARPGKAPQGRSGTRPRKQTTDILESLTDGFFAVDRDWRWTSVNAAAEQRANNRPRSAFLGKNHWDLFKEAVERIRTKLPPCPC